MKSLILSFLLPVTIITGAQGQSMLKVHLADNSQINVSVDGRYFNVKGTSVTVGDLPPGRHAFTIYAVQQDRRGRGREESVYSGRVTTHAGYVTLFTYDPYSQQTDVQEQEANTYAQVPHQPDNGYGSGNNNNTQAPQVNNNNNDYGNDNKYIQPSDAPLASPVAPESMATLTGDKTDKLKKKAADKKTDTEKMNVLKEGLAGEKITTDQVGAMMDWFNFESSKVDFAKWAFQNTVDKENYTNLETKLTYKNYEDDLDTFIKNNGK